MSNLIRWRDYHPMLPLLLVASIIVLLAVAAARDLVARLAAGR